MFIEAFETKIIITKAKATTGNPIFGKFCILLIFKLFKLTFLHPLAILVL